MSIFYANPIRCGLDAVVSLADGYSIQLKWFSAYSNSQGNGIAYHIYYSTEKQNVFSNGVKFIVIDGSLSANIIGLQPGKLYYFSVRPVEYVGNALVNDGFISLVNDGVQILLVQNFEDELPLVYDNLRIYPSTILRNNITSSDLIIPLEDISNFPDLGIIKIGVELIQYSLVDRINNNLLLTTIDQRGFDETIAREHTIDGYDGDSYWSSTVSFFIDGEDTSFDRIFMCQCRFDYPNFPFNLVDGYRQETTDLLNTDLSVSDEENVDFPPLDHSGYHRTDPVMLIDGTCVGSYIGGEYGCINSNGVYNIYRGISIQDQNNQKQEELLSMTGRPAILIKRVYTGITCNCYLATSEYQDDRCPQCLGSKFVLGYQQYFNPRRSDGRIMIRLSPADDGVKVYDSGLESEINLDAWTLTVPTLHQRDIILLFDLADNREFLYEVGTVSRNNTVLAQEGAQKFKMIRIRKTDPAYQIRIFDNTSMFPTIINTTIGGIIGTIPLHSHEIVRNEKDPSTWSQMTGTAQGHRHAVIIQNGLPTVMDVLDHGHTILI